MALSDFQGDVGGMAEASVVVPFPLRGPNGELVDLWRTLVSHGVASLPPMRVDEGRRTLAVTLPVTGSPPRQIEIAVGEPGHGVVRIGGAPPDAAVQQILACVRRMLCLDDDLSGFYALALADPDLAWATAGAGRMLRSPTVFEDVVKTICTTNCAWSATERMVGALVAHLGEPARETPASSPVGRAFPTPRAMAEADEAFYRDVVRAGYRGRYLQTLARSVAAGEVDLEALATATPAELSDDAVAARLLALPGVGPYTAAHVMMLLGRHSRLVFDSWTRPKYARLTGGDLVPDQEIARRFAPYGRYAGLAFWLYLTRDWVPEPAVEPALAAK